jgi:hypothetical protein
MTIATDMPESQFARGYNGLMIIPRRRFAESYFHYKPGQHVVAIGPTQMGKTSLYFDLLEFCATPQLPAYVCVVKPADKVTKARGPELGFREVDTWPAAKKFGELVNGPPRGYIIWPKYGNLDTDVIECARVARSLLTDRYSQGARGKKGIIVMQDTMVQSKIMGNDEPMVNLLAMAGAMGLGEWLEIQKLTDSGRTNIWSQSACVHKFMRRDPVSTNQKKYGEVSGMDPKFVMGATDSLAKFQQFYVQSDEQWACIVDASERTI